MTDHAAEQSSAGAFPADGETEFDTEVEASADAAEAGVDPLAAAEAKVAELTSDLQRLQAEYVNYRKRVDRDRDLVVENAKFTVLSALLPVLDAIDRARSHGPLEDGFNAIAEQLDRVVEGQGLTKFGAAGEPFDPQMHEALMHGHSADVTEPTVQDLVTAGYRMGERVVRAATVTVVDPE